MGWDSQSLVAKELAVALEETGVAAITVHGRTRGQKYAGQADWPAIREVVESVRTIPVIGNGDVTSPDTARALWESTGCAGIMIGRAALKNPWLMRAIWNSMRGFPAEQCVSAEERRAFLIAHLDRHLAQYGDAGGVVLFRKWIPQYVKAAGLSRERMAKVMTILGVDTLRGALLEMQGDAIQRRVTP